MSKDWLSVNDLAHLVNEGKLSAVDLVKKSLERISRSNDEFKAIISTIEDRSLARAKEIDNKVKKGANAGRLAGVPFIAKDNFLTLGSETTAASNILKGFRAPYQSSAIEKLEAEGAICVAKANLDAFAHGSSTENSDFFTTLNPHDKTLIPGGSSGGSAAAVVLGMAPFALGSDTGGSIRLPASFTGCVGLKPTYGLVSRSGVVAMASSLDCIGPITSNVEDAALILDVMAGRDPLDSTTIERDPEGYNVASSEGNAIFSKMKVGIVKEYFAEGLDPDIKESVEQAIDKLKSAGVKIKEVSLPSLPLALAVYYIICPAEVSSNLSRYDGQRFGYTHKQATTLDESYELSREQGFGKEAKRRIMTGTYVLSSGYYDAYYKKAQTVRTRIIDEFNEALKSVDLLIGPTAPTTAFKVGANSADPLKMYLTDILTVAANLAGVPSISIPSYVSKRNNMPVGLQMISGQKKDRELLEFAKAVEGLIQL